MRKLPPGVLEANRAAYLRRYRQTHREKIYAGQKAWRAKNPDKVKARDKRYQTLHRAEIRERRRDYSKFEAIKRNYGLTKEKYFELLAVAHGKCQVCSGVFSKENPACVDHCHDTGVVRGLLCHACNIAEGAVKTSTRALALYHYILRNELSRQGDN